MNIIEATDFMHNTKDPRYARRMWNEGALRHVIAALDGREALVVTDKQTGHVQRGVLVKITAGYSGHDARVYLRSTLSDGTEQTTAFLMMNVGAIIDTDESFSRGAKWVAIETYGKEQSAAIAYVRAALGEAPEGAIGWSFEASTFVGELHVRYEAAYIGGDKPNRYQRESGYKRVSVDWLNV